MEELPGSTGCARYHGSLRGIDGILCSFAVLLSF